jgi:hypothetical protein
MVIVMAILAVPADVVEVYAVSIALTGADVDADVDVVDADVDGVAGEPDVLAVPQPATLAAMTAAHKPTRTGRTFCLPQLVYRHFGAERRDRLVSRQCRTDLGDTSCCHTNE